MGTLAELIPIKLLHRFLIQHGRGSKLLVVSLAGPHAAGYHSKTTPIELKGIHVEPTENLVGLTAAPRAQNWVGDFEEQLIDYSSEELGQGLKKLLKGDGSILERILTRQQLCKSEDLRRLQAATKGIVCRRFFNHYRSFSRGVLREYEDGEQRSVRLLLASYRSALSGVHLLRTGKIVLELMTLARLYGFGQIEELVKTYQENNDAVLAANNRWLNRLVKLHSMLESSLETSKLPIDPEHPHAVEEYLMDMRRRFFDALTVQQ